MTNSEIIALLTELAQTCHCDTCKHGEHVTIQYCHKHNMYPDIIGCFDWQPRDVQVQ